MNYTRIGRLVTEAVEKYKLDLDGLTIFTEAASGSFLATPVIAAKAGADVVFAIGNDSAHGTFASVAANITELTKEMGLPSIIFTVNKQYVMDADIVTNTGWVRPIDEEVIGWMKESAVIAMMMEEWEWRPEDVDVGAAKARDIPLVPVDETYIHPYDAELVIKMIHELGMVVRDNRFRVIGSDRFAYSVMDYITDVGGYLAPEMGREDLTIVATLTEEVEVPEGALVIANNRRMAHTAGYVGPRPVIELRTKALKEAEKVWRRKNT